MTIVGKKSFIVMTLLIPFLIIVLGCVPVLLAYVNDSTDTSVTRIAVIDEGHIVEEGKTVDVFANPQSDVTRELLDWGYKRTDNRDGEEEAVRD